MGFQSLSRVFTGLAFLVLALPAARADDAITPPKIDLTRWSEQPVYPDGAVERREQGNTVLSVDISSASKPTKVTVETSSGFADLDEAAVAAVKGLRFDAAVSHRKDIAGTMKLTIHYQLTPLPYPPFTETDVYALREIDELIVCKTPAPTLGSNITPKSVCRTKREWDAINRLKKDQNIPERHNGPFVPN